MQAQTNTINIDLQIPINAKIEVVWRCLVNDINIWWSKDFYTSPKTINFILEPFVGGRMYEDYGDNNGLLWANVIVVDAPNVLELKGHLSPQFGGPAISFMKLTLSEENKITTLNLTETTMGMVTENTKKQLTEGWKMIYGDAFKSYVESQ